MWSVEMVMVAVLILFNGVYAAYEIALASVGLTRLKALQHEGRRGAQAAVRMKERIEASLAVIQLGITLVGVAAAVTGGAGADESVKPILVDWGFSAHSAEMLAIVVVIVPLTLFTLIVGELLPKVFALRNKEWVCLTLSPAMYWFSYAVWPVVWILEWSVRAIIALSTGAPVTAVGGPTAGDTVQEIHEAAGVARMTRLIGHREEGIILSASRLAATPLSRVMLPAEYIGMLSSDQSLSDALLTAHQEMHTRFPVTEARGNPQRIVGYVNFKDIVSALRMTPRNPSIMGLVRRLPDFRSDLSVADCLEHLIREHNHMALVRDHRGQVVGLVTLEDIVEELVGEIYDEFDRLPNYLTRAGAGWIAGGFVSLARVRDETGIDLLAPSEKPLYSLNDWILEHLGRPPKGGDEVCEADIRIAVRKTRHTLVQEAYIEKMGDQPSGIDQQH